MNKRFRTTPWSLVLTAKKNDNDAGMDALEELCQRYWFPLYAHVRRRGYTTEDSEDLTQSFFAHLLEKNFLEYVDSTKGRFRSFLLAALNHFLSDQWDRSQALKRGGRHTHFSLDVDKAEDLIAEASATQLTPDALYDRHWAQTLMAASLRDTSDEYAAMKKEDLFEAIKCYVTSTAEGPPYADVAQHLETTEGAVKVAVHRLRKRLGKAMRKRIAKTLDSPEEVEHELKYLLGTL